jgi:hypothetical protein
MGAGAEVRLSGGIPAGNVVWQVLGAVSIGANANLVGVVLMTGAGFLGAGEESCTKKYATLTAPSLRCDRGWEDAFKGDSWLNSEFESDLRKKQPNGRTKKDKDG